MYGMYMDRRISWFNSHRTTCALHTTYIHTYIHTGMYVCLSSNSWLQGANHQLLEFCSLHDWLTWLINTLATESCATLYWPTYYTH